MPTPYTFSIGDGTVFHMGKSAGDPWTALNPATNKWEPFVQAGNEGDPDSGLPAKYGFQSDFPGFPYGGQGPDRPEYHSSQGLGLGPLPLLAIPAMAALGGAFGGFSGGAADLAGTGASAFTDFGAANTGFGNLAASLSPEATGALTAGGNISGPLMEGLLTDPATGLPITPPMYEGGAPNFPGTPGNPVSNAADLARTLGQAGSPGANPSQPQVPGSPPSLSPGSQNALNTAMNGTPRMSVPTAASGPTAPPSGPVGGSPVAGSAGAGTAEGGSMIDKILSQMRSNPLGAIGAGIGAAGLLGKQKPLPNEAQINALGQEASGVARDLIAQYRSGNLSASQQSQISQLTQQTKNQINQYFASIGQSDSTSHTQALAQVDQQALGMKQQMLDNALQQGLTAIGVAQGPLNTVAQYQLGQDNALRQAFGSFAGAVGNMAGRSSGTQTPATPAQPGPG